MFVCGFAPLSSVGLFAIVGVFRCLRLFCLYLFMEDKSTASEEEDDEEASVSSPGARKKMKKRVLEGQNIKHIYITIIKFHKLTIKLNILYKS